MSMTKKEFDLYINIGKGWKRGKTVKATDAKLAEIEGLRSLKSSGQVKALPSLGRRRK